LRGFTVYPAGLRRNGKGLTSAGWLVLKKLGDHLGAFSLTIDATAPSQVRKTKQGAHVILNHAQLREILADLARIKSESFANQTDMVGAYLANVSSALFPVPAVDRQAFKPGDVAALLKRKDVLKQLSAKDVDALTVFFPGFLKEYSGRVVGTEKLLALSKSKRAVEIVYIDKITKEFERRLKQKNATESSWQEFLRAYILVFNTNYASVLEKESVALQGKFPDFLLIDAYNYLDIYEIKKPTTNLLKKDESRGNYYWDVEVAKAISQVENYIAQVDRNAATFCEEIRKRKGIDVRVMKPRAFIIGGHREQLTNETMADNFRILNRALTNVEIILYDELLDNVKNFLKRLRQ
jgi:hypothetical protein